MCVIVVPLPSGKPPFVVKIIIIISDTMSRRTRLVTVDIELQFVTQYRVDNRHRRTSVKISLNAVSLGSPKESGQLLACVVSLHKQ
jgi:hypothetical protein